MLEIFASSFKCSLLTFQQAFSVHGTKMVWILRRSRKGLIQWLEFLVDQGDNFSVFCWTSEAAAAHTPTPSIKSCWCVLVFKCLAWRSLCLASSSIVLDLWLNRILGGFKTVETLDLIPREMLGARLKSWVQNGRNLGAGLKQLKDELKFSSSKLCHL